MPDGERVITCVPERMPKGRRLYTLPTAAQGSEKAKLQVLAAYEVAKREARKAHVDSLVSHRKRGHMPRDPDCIDCDRGELKQKAARRGKDANRGIGGLS